MLLGPRRFLWILLGITLVCCLAACGSAEPILKSAVGSPSATPETVKAPSGPPKKYASCAKLNKDYPHGVARSSKAAAVQVKAGYGEPAYGKKAAKVYAKNKANLDRDDDGTACQG